MLLAVLGCFVVSLKMNGDRKVLGLYTEGDAGFVKCLSDNDEPLLGPNDPTATPPPLTTPDIVKAAKTYYMAYVKCTHKYPFRTISSSFRLPDYFECYRVFNGTGYVPLTECLEKNGVHNECTSERTLYENDIFYSEEFYKKVIKPVCKKDCVLDKPTPYYCATTPAVAIAALVIACVAFLAAVGAFAFIFLKGGSSA